MESYSFTTVIPIRPVYIALNHIHHHHQGRHLGEAGVLWPQRICDLARFFAHTYRIHIATHWRSNRRCKRGCMQDLCYSFRSFL